MYFFVFDSLFLHNIFQIYQNSYLYQFFFRCEVVFHCMNIAKFIHSAVDGHLNNFISFAGGGKRLS